MLPIIRSRGIKIEPAANIPFWTVESLRTFSISTTKLPWIVKFLQLVWFKHSGSIPRNVCVACETKQCVTKKNTTTKKVWHSKNACFACMCLLRNIAMRDQEKCDYQESVTIRQTDAGRNDPYVPICFIGDKKWWPCTIVIRGLTFCIIIQHWIRPWTHVT